VKSVIVIALLGIGCGSNSTPCDRTTPGNICTIAGNGTDGYAGEEGAALDAELSLPMDTLWGPDQNLYVVDWNNHRIRKITSDGVIHWVAGNGELGGSLDDPATGDFNHPTGILFDPTGTLIYISAWHNSKIRVLDIATGIVSDSCGDGKRAYDGDGGPALTATLNLPASIAWDPTGNLTIMDQANQVIRNVDSTNTIHRIAGNCIIDQSDALGGPGACAEGVAPMACAAPSEQTVCNTPSYCGVTACGAGYTGDEIPALDMRMAQTATQAADPGGRILYDPAGNLYFADTQNDLIRMIDPQGVTHLVAGTPPVNGVAQSGFTGDGGPATAATLFHPIDLALGADGTLYFTDTYNHCVRAIGTDKTIRTVVGQCGTKGYSGDGGPATEALLAGPYGLEWAPPNTLYIADTSNNVIRAVTLP
jgi:DNA-binding beta-propeller fold protein YncE